MAKPYALTLYSPALDSPRFEAALTQDAKGWKRSKRDNGGCWQGSFSMEGSATTLQGYFRRWLAYDLRERAGGMMSWRGLIYEMDLTLNGITRRRSLDLMANRVKTTYLTMDYVGENFIHNGSFLDYDAVGPPNDFYGWYEKPATTIVAAAGAHSGATCLQLNSNGVENDVWIRQNMDVTPGAKYKLTLWCKGDGAALGGGASGEFALRNPNGPTHWMIGPVPTMNSTANWIERTIYFTGPSEGEAMLFLYAPRDAGRVAFFDDVVVLEEQETVYETPFASIDGTGAIIETYVPSGSTSAYGVKEEIIHLDGYPEETSLSYRSTYLHENAYPWARPVSASKKSEARLDVKVAGYIFTMNWLYVMTGNGEVDDLAVWIRKMLGVHTGLDQLHGGTIADSGDCQWVRYGIVRNNDYLSTPNGPLQAPQLTGVEERPWDVIQELIQLGDYDGNSWRGWVGLDNLFNYEPINTNPRYYIRKSGIYDTMAGNTPSNPWLMQPGVFRDMTYRPSATEPGSFLGSVQDMYVEEVEMADGWDQPALKTGIFTEAEVLLAQGGRGEIGEEEGAPLLTRFER